MSRNDALLEAFAAELRARRSKAKLSQEELAYRADVNRTYVAKLELAKNQPTLGVLHSLALALNDSLPDLLHGTLRRYSIGGKTTPMRINGRSAQSTGSSHVTSTPPKERRIP